MSAIEPPIGFAPHYQVASSEQVGTVIDERYPASEISDLQLARMALTAHHDALLERYAPRQVAFAERVAAGRLAALHAGFVDPNGDAEQLLREALNDNIASRTAGRERVRASYGPDDTLPPDAYASVDLAWDGPIREIEELLADLQSVPKPKMPRISPFWLGPVRRAISLEYRTATDPAARTAALDVAERRLLLALPRAVRGARVMRRAAHMAVSGLTSLI